MTRAVAFNLVTVCAMLAACGDPVRDDKVSALGGEVAGVPRGELHRGGQPCVLCHSEGSEAPPFAMAGTVYRDVNSRVPVAGISVAVVDSSKTTYRAVTNCAGNFFMRADQISLQFPVWISLRASPPDGMIVRDMDSPIYREGSCAGCHSDPIGSASAGHVYAIDDPQVDILPSHARCP